MSPYHANTFIWHWTKHHWKVLYVPADINMKEMTPATFDFDIKIQWVFHRMLHVPLKAEIMNEKLIE